MRGLTLSGPTIAEGSNTIRPEILVALKGPITAPKRTIDVSTLAGFLMLRSVERQAKTLDVIEAERRTPSGANGTREAERREAERRDAERRELEARAAAAAAAMPPPSILDESGTAAPPPQRAVASAKRPAASCGARRRTRAGAAAAFEYRTRSGRREIDAHRAPGAATQAPPRCRRRARRLKRYSGYSADIAGRPPPASRASADRAPALPASVR